MGYFIPFLNQTYVITRRYQLDINIQILPDLCIFSIAASCIYFFNQDVLINYRSKILQRKYHFTERFFMFIRFPCDCLNMIAKLPVILVSENKKNVNYFTSTKTSPYTVRFSSAFPATVRYNFSTFQFNLQYSWKLPLVRARNAARRLPPTRLAENKVQWFMTYLPLRRYYFL